MYPEPLFDTCWDAIDNFDRLGGITMSIILAALGIFGAFWVGLVVGLMRQSKRRIFKYPSMAYIEVIRGVPLIMLIFWFFFLAPMLLGQAMPKFWTTLVAFIIFTSAYIAEIVRAGIQSLPSGQTEAARGTGLSGIQSMMFVILPQALRNMIPSFVNQFVSLTKDTSLASIIGVNELFLSANQVNQRELTAPMEVFTTIAVMYFVICYVLTATSRRLERQMARYQARDR
ncbi:MAG: amino acid ABC transporter permease [Desulfovibrio sp.]|nr:MAG: amino acid ABC transporter permease [Desulfovibrio sp.]